MTALANDLPVWDMTPIFPSLASEEFVAEFEALCAGIETLAALFDTHNVNRRLESSVDAAFVAQYEEIIEKTSALQQRLRAVSSYIGCFVTTDARDDAARSRESLLSARSVRLQKLYTRLVAWVGTTDTEALLAASGVARDLEYNVRRAAEQAKHQMSPVEEDLASELQSPGISGWVKLHANLTAMLNVPLTVDGETKSLPMSAVRSLATDSRREVRKAAFEAEIAAWAETAMPLAAALNGVKGYQQVVRKRRGYANDIEPTLSANGIDAETLEAMHTACVESFPDFRRYMNAKAKALGVEKLEWYDVSAPLGEEGKSWSWSEAETFVETNFARYSHRLAGFARMNFTENWIDAGQRVGKVGGAYCTGLRPGESRILMNYNGSFNSVSTLAHELGHAYHNLNLKERKSMQRATPATLAETASIFCETLAFDGALASADNSERLVLLDTVLERNLMVVVDIHSRFLFEKSVFAKRQEREITVAEFKELMTTAQQQTYGDALNSTHPFMWAVKGHYYNSGFYNYPYTFGLLFGLGLYARFQASPDEFRADYDDFLSSTGMYDAHTLAARFGIDTHSVEFWRSSLDVIRIQIGEFDQLIG